MSRKVNLNTFSKADLVWIIEYFVKWHGDFYLERALSELKFRKETERIDRADQYAKTSHAKRLEYIELLAPYDGQPWSSIPHEVLCKAEKLMKEAQAADKKYMSLMGIKGV